MRRHVLVQAEDVLRIVLPLQCQQARVVLTVGRSDTFLAVIAEEVDISAPLADRPERFNDR